MLGNGRLEALCFDGEKRLAHIRGKLRKKVWINQGDIILLSLRDYQDEKGDVILKYSADEARSLKAYGELPESAKINETDTYVSSSPPSLCQFSLFSFFRYFTTELELMNGIDMATRAETTATSSSTRTGTAQGTTRISTSMRSELLHKIFPYPLLMFHNQAPRCCPYCGCMDDQRGRLAPFLG